MPNDCGVDAVGRVFALRRGHKVGCMDEIAQLERWTDSGAHWRVLARTPTTVAIALVTCTGDEEVDRLVSGDPALLDWLGSRRSSDAD